MKLDGEKEEGPAVAGRGEGGGMALPRRRRRTGGGRAQAAGDGFSNAVEEPEHLIAFYFYFEGVLCKLSLLAVIVLILGCSV